MSSNSKTNPEYIDFLAKMLETNPYTTPHGEVLHGQEGAIRFIELFFPEELEDE